MLENELKELRQKLIDSETERDQLRSDLDLAKKRAKITNSRYALGLQLDQHNELVYNEEVGRHSGIGISIPFTNASQIELAHCMFEEGGLWSTVLPPHHSTVIRASSNNSEGNEAV